MVSSTRSVRPSNHERGAGKERRWKLAHVRDAIRLKSGGAPMFDHISITVADVEKAKAFYEAALAAGAKDNGPPGIRAHYHPNYYGAFVIDPDGHNLEAVCHLPG
jgi:hypothetical protein